MILLTSWHSLNWQDQIYLAERTWSETETTANGGPPCGQRPGHQIGSPASSPSAASPLFFSGRSVDSTPPWPLSIMARRVLHLKATSTALRS